MLLQVDFKLVLELVDCVLLDEVSVLQYVDFAFPRNIIQVFDQIDYLGLFILLAILDRRCDPNLVLYLIYVKFVFLLYCVLQEEVVENAAFIQWIPHELELVVSWESVGVELV